MEQNDVEADRIRLLTDEDCEAGSHGQESHLSQSAIEISITSLSIGHGSGKIPQEMTVKRIYLPVQAKELMDRKARRCHLSVM